MIMLEWFLLYVEKPTVLTKKKPKGLLLAPSPQSRRGSYQAITKIPLIREESVQNEIDRRLSAFPVLDSTPPPYLSSRTSSCDRHFFSSATDSAIGSKPTSNNVRCLNIEYPKYNILDFLQK